MRLHPRERIVREARTELIRAVIDWARKNREPELTTYEELMIVSSVLGDALTGTLKYAIREERHKHQDKPGGVE